MIFAKLFWAFFKIGAVGFGGGMAIVGMIYDTIRGFVSMTPSQYADIVAIAQVTPGPVAVNTATYVGYQTAGMLGSLVATLGVATPAFILVAIIAGISAKEVVVSSTAILFRVSNVNSEAGMAAVHAGLSAMGFGPLNAYCLMVFCLLYIPCAATIGVIHRESRSWKWTAFSVCFQLVMAWVVSFVIYQVGSLLLA